MCEKGKLVRNILRAGQRVVAAGMMNGSGDSLDPEGLRESSVVSEGRTIDVRRIQLAVSALCRGPLCSCLP